MVTLVTVCGHGKVKGKNRGIPIQAWTVPEDSRRLKLPEFQDNRHVKVARLLAPRTGPLYPPGNIPGTRFRQKLSQPQGRKDYVNEKFQ
jgi:hypothetical protein